MLQLAKVSEIQMNKTEMCIMCIVVENNLKVDMNFNLKCEKRNFFFFMISERHCFVIGGLFSSGGIHYAALLCNLLKSFLFASQTEIFSMREKS